MTNKKIRKNKRRSGGRKGHPFERQMAVRLSLWWSDNEREDLIWRSSGSGGRATVRGRRGKQTAGHVGDLSPCDPCVKPLFDLVSIELKKGYSKDTPFDMIDRPRYRLVKGKRVEYKQETFESFVEKAMKGQENSGSFSWWLIVMRDRREAMLFMPETLEEHLVAQGVVFPKLPFLKLRCRLRFKETHQKQQIITIVGVTLEKFLNACEPKAVKKLAREL